MTHRTTTIQTAGRRMTTDARPCQKGRVSRPRTKGSASRSTVPPKTASRAGIKVSEESTEIATTITPPNPIDHTTLRRDSISAPNPMATVQPEISVATPAVATVVATASDGSVPARSSSRNRFTTSSE